jgi:hypothetical protein
MDTHRRCLGLAHIIVLESVMLLPGSAPAGTPPSRLEHRWTRLNAAWRVSMTTFLPSKSASGREPGPRAEPRRDTGRPVAPVRFTDLNVPVKEFCGNEGVQDDRDSLPRVRHGQSRHVEKPWEPCN